MWKKAFTEKSLNTSLLDKGNIKLWSSFFFFSFKLFYFKFYPSEANQIKFDQILNYFFLINLKKIKSKLILI